MQPSVSIVIPAWNEGHTIAVTLQALHQVREQFGWWNELIVVDDGSIDDTCEKAMPWVDKLIIHQQNKGKGTALQAGCNEASHPIILLLDADLGESVIHAVKLLDPIFNNEADMTIGRFQTTVKKAGFGLVKALAIHGIYWLSGYKTNTPLSGQRAILKKMVTNSKGMSKGFGIEVGLTIDAARSGYRICEIDIPFHHRETGRDWHGFVHRGKQFISVGRTLFEKWMHPIC